MRLAISEGHLLDNDLLGKGRRIMGGEVRQSWRCRVIRRSSGVGWRARAG